MATGYPDYLGWAGRAGAGESVVAYSFSVAVSGESSGSFDLPTVNTGYENYYQNIVISCADDTAIHRVVMFRVSDGWAFFSINFINGGIFDFPGQSFPAGATARVQITNNSASSLTFEGTVFYTTRPI